MRILIHLYLRKGLVYLPVLARTEAGFYIETDPVVVETVDSPNLRKAFVDTIAKGNPRVPVPDRDAWPQWVVLKHAKVRSMSAFERSALHWDIEQDEEGVKIIYMKPSAPRGWVRDPDQTIAYPPGTQLDDVIDRMIAILQEAANGAGGG